MRLPVPVLAVTLAIAAFPAAAQQAQQSLSRQDRNFVEEATEGGIEEVQLGKLAAERAENDQVKTFGQRMIADHSQANQRLSEIAQRAGLPPAKEPSRSEQRKTEKLGKLSGAEFDKEYISTMVDDHKKTIDAFEKQAKKGEHAELKTFAQDTLPKLEQHYDMAKRLRETLQQQAQIPR